MNERDFLIRTSKPDDAAAFAAFMSEPEVFGNLMQLPYPSESAWRERLAGPKPGSNDLSLVVKQEGQVVASAGLFSPGLHVRRRHVCIRIRCGGKAHSPLRGRAGMMPACTAWNPSP